VTTFHSGLVAALQRQRERRQSELAAGAQRVGWKVGQGDWSEFGVDLAFGYLTSATQLDPGATYAGGGEQLYADAELAVQIRADAIATYAPAIEIVDLGGPSDPEAVVATNIWHRAFALGTAQPSLPDAAQARLIVNGEVRGTAPPPDDLHERVRVVAQLLTAVGERLEPGDWIITGNVAQVPVADGDEVTADFGALGAAELRIA
jgi:2-keto-4-pentenoate hydratase